MYIYILKLKDNKYYIGKTTNPSKRLQDHHSHNGSSWTKKYDPIELLELIETNDPFDEDKFTLKYMAKYGIDNVRGGSFTQIILDNPTIQHIKKMITSATDKCFKCNKIGHFARECYQDRFLNKKSKKNDDYDYFLIVIILLLFICWFIFEILDKN